MVVRKRRPVAHDESARLPNLSKRFLRDNRIDADRLVDEILRKTSAEGLVAPEELRQILAGHNDSGNSSISRPCKKSGSD